MNHTIFPTTGLVNRQAACAFLSIGITKFYELIQEGALPKPRKIGKSSRWRAEDIRRFAGYDDAEVNHAK